MRQKNYKCVLYSDAALHEFNHEWRRLKYECSRGKKTKMVDVLGLLSYELTRKMIYILG